MHLYLLPSKITPLKNIREIVSFCKYRIKTVRIRSSYKQKGLLTHFLETSLYAGMSMKLLFTLDANTNETGKDIVTVFIGQVGVALFWTVVVFICWGISLTSAYIQS